MRFFSQTVAELYERAAYASAHDFPLEAIRLMRKLLRMDGAVIGIGSSGSILAKNIAVDRKFPTEEMCVRDNDECIAAHGTDFIASPFFDPAANALPVIATSACGKLAEPGWSRFIDKHGINSMLIHGDLEKVRFNARSIMLYRFDSQPFDDLDAEILLALWPHLRQATYFNLGRALQQNVAPRPSRGMALVNAGGLIETADKTMSDLLRLEWNEFDGKSIPVPALDALLQNGTYCGKRIELTGFHKHGYMACSARCLPPTRMLTQSELNVAHRFARGMTYKEIAAHSGVSPYTVRNQLAQVYAKLGVHSKAELARMMPDL